LLALLSHLVALPLAAVPVPVEVWVVRQGWTAAASPERVAEALALRLPGVRVIVVDAPVDGGAACTVLLEAADSGLPRLTVRCPAGAPVLESLPAAPDLEVARRAAVEAAILVEALMVPRAQAPAPATLAPVPPREPANPSRPPVVVAPTPPPGAPVRAALRLAGGVALAPELPDTAYALTVDGRVFLGARAHLTGGATLAGPLSRTQGQETDQVSDRSLWVGAGYRVAFDRLSVDASLALAYTIPLLDAQGEAEGELREEDRASRLGLRAGAVLGWSLHPSLAVVAELAARVSFVERTIVSGGREKMELGALVLDSTVGLELRL
jgi:hypothetical protein